MVSSVRKVFNSSFTPDSYTSFLGELENLFPGALDFRLAETPVFVSRQFLAEMLDTCEKIIDVILNPHFIRVTDAAVPHADKVPGEIRFPQMLAFDFGVCESTPGLYQPQLVEMQGFPSLFAFQDVYPNILRKHVFVPENFSQYIGGHNHQSFNSLFREVLLGSHNAENVILLELRPHQQKTRIDFYCTNLLTGVEPVCLTDLFAEGNKLFYKKEDRKIPVHRIYNRVIFDELHSRSDLGEHISLSNEYDVEWVPHPDWFYRVSKYTLPFLDHPNIPKTYFVNELKQLPGDLKDYVLKPLFSFAGQGVIIEPQQADIQNITDPENWILQKKVRYADAVETPDGPAKTEIRIMYLWKDDAPRPEPVINLARLSKGQMIGTRYNKDKTWVGGSVAFFEQ